MPHNKKNLLSVVIAVYNDEEVLLELYKRLLPVILSITNYYEIIFIDDGSIDSSYDILQLLHHKDKNIKIIKLTKNFGQPNSIACGLDHAKGDLVVLMDSDLQDRPEDIPKLIEALGKEKSHMAIAKWITRKDSSIKKLVSHFFYKLSERITNIHHTPQLGVFRVIRKEVLDEIKKIPEKTGTTLSLLYWSGFNYTAVDLHRDSRFAGTSSYDLKKMIKLTTDRIFSYSLFPIRIASYIGITMGITGLIAGLLLIIRKLLNNNIATGWTSIFVIVLILFSINFFFLGIIGEYLGRIYNETKGKPKYIIEKIV